MTVDVVDLFAGPGGWDEGLATLRYPGTVVGVEWDHDACRTATAAGHLRVEADVAAYPTDPFDDVDGLIASPPCQAFSMAGKGAGRDAAAELLAHVRTCADGWVDPPDRLCSDDVRADLTLQPLRWADALRPRWIACEQVPPALPLWIETARVLKGWGYSTWAGKLNSEEYGVPQTRTRAFLIARRDGPPAGPPAPTHTAWDPRASDGGKTPQPSLFGPELKPWLSMAEGLGWAATYVNGNQANATVRRPDEPAPTVHFGNNMNEVRWMLAGAGATAESTAGQRPRDMDQPAHTITGAGSAAWVRDRHWGHDAPATTIAGDPRMTGRAHHDPGTQGRNPVDVEDALTNGASRERSVRVTLEQAARLQSFPDGYPWHGTKTSRHAQVGNAVPPLLAAAVLAPLIR